jgi:hypothetical protein
MPVWDEIQEGFEAAFDAEREVFGEDLCDLIEVVKADDGAGHKFTDNPVATNVPCLVEELSPGSVTVVSGGVAVIASHRIEVKRSSPALALKVSGKIKVLARTGKVQMIFEQPIRKEETFTPTVEFRAVLVKSGYREPGIT